MTIKELIIKLQALPQDVEIHCINTYEDWGYDTDLNEEIYYDATSIDPVTDIEYDERMGIYIIR